MTVSEDPAQIEAAADRAAAARDFSAAAALLGRLAAGSEVSPALWMKLAGARRASGDPAGALAAVSGALRYDPLALLPLLLRARLLDTLTDPMAGEAYGEALTRAPEDESTLPPAIRREIDNARTSFATWREARGARMARAIAAAAPTASAGEAARLDRFRTNALRETRPYPQAPSHFAFPGLPLIEFYDAAAFPGVAALEATTEAIRADFEAVVAAEAAELVPYVQYPDDVPVAQWAALNRSRDWTAIHLIRNGMIVEGNARHCAATLAAYAELDSPRVPGRGPNLMFSLLAPGVRIPPHSGVANTRLVLHLPLIVPPRCSFRVGATTIEWTPGRAIAFDDTIEHEAWNESGELRVVLIGDLWRPELSPAERAGVAAVMTAEQVAGGL